MEENNILDASTLLDEPSINSNSNETSPLFRQSSLFQYNIQVSSSNESVIPPSLFFLSFIQAILFFDLELQEI